MLGLWSRLKLVVIQIISLYAQASLFLSLFNVKTPDTSAMFCNLFSSKSKSLGFLHKKFIKNW